MLCHKVLCIAVWLLVRELNIGGAKSNFVHPIAAILYSSPHGNKGGKAGKSWHTKLRETKHLSEKTQDEGT